MTKLKPSFRGPHLAPFFSKRRSLRGFSLMLTPKAATRANKEKVSFDTQGEEKEREREKKQTNFMIYLFKRGAESHGVCLMRRVQTSRSQSIN